MASAARAFAKWLEEVFIPKIAPILEDFFLEDRLWVLVLRDLGQYFVGMALVYPIILRMRVKN